MRRHCAISLLVCALVLGLSAPRVVHAQTITPRASLQLAIAELSALMARTGLAAAFSTVVDSQVVLVWDDAPIVQGKLASARLLLAQKEFALLQIEMTPELVDVSDDGQFGVSWGVLFSRDQRVPTAPLRVGRYLSAWKRNAGAWKLLAFAPLGDVFPMATVLPAAIPSIPFGIELRGAVFAHADSMFSAMAGKQGAPTAFAAFAAPDVITFPIDGIAIGPLNVKTRMEASGAGRLQWEWKPMVADGAADGSLGFTVGDAIIRGKTSDRSASITYAKYLTLWRKQSDGSVRFLTDGGNGRPVPVSR